MSVKLKRGGIKKPPKGNETIGAQKFFDIVMNNVTRLVNDQLLHIRREISDIKLQVKEIRMNQKSYELDYKALGFTLSELGLIELNILNKTKNMVRDKLAVVTSNGQVVGKVNVTRYNLTPTDKNILVCVPVNS